MTSCQTGVCTEHPKSVLERNSRAAGEGWDGLNVEDQGGPKLPKQELMSIIVLGKNKSHLKSSRIPKQPVTPVTCDGGKRKRRPGGV